MLPGCINIELNMDIKKDILFLNKRMDAVQNEGTSALLHLLL